MPQPASLKGAKGVRFEKATEVTADLVRFIEDPSVAKEGYDLRIEPEGIAVSAATETGRFYALETLKQLALPLSRGETVKARYAAKLALTLLADADRDDMDLATLRLEMIEWIQRLLALNAK